MVIWYYAPVSIDCTSLAHPVVSPAAQVALTGMLNVIRSQVKKIEYGIGNIGQQRYVFGEGAREGEIALPLNYEGVSQFVTQILQTNATTWRLNLDVKWTCCPMSPNGKIEAKPYVVAYLVSDSWAISPETNKAYREWVLTMSGLLGVPFPYHSLDSHEVKYLSTRSQK